METLSAMAAYKCWHGSSRAPLLHPDPLVWFLLTLGQDLHSQQLNVNCLTRFLITWGLICVIVPYSVSSLVLSDQMLADTDCTVVAAENQHLNDGFMN